MHVACNIYLKKKSGKNYIKGMLQGNIEHFLKKRIYEKLEFSEMS